MPKNLNFLAFAFVLVFVSACSKDSKEYKFHPQSKEELKALVKNLDVNLAEIDTSKITDMSYLFALSNRKDFSGIETWNTSKVESMRSMFDGAYHFNQNINSWNTSKVENMSGVFASAKSFNQALDKWNTSKVTNMNYMFWDATNFNQNINSWNTSRVTSMKAMFSGANSFNQALDKWNTNKVTDMSIMFDESPLQNNPPKWYKGI